MDPISILGVIGTAIKIIDTCVDAGYNIQQIKRRWKEAPAVLNSIAGECVTLQATMRNINL